MKIQNINNYPNYNSGTKPIKKESIKTKNYDVIEINGKSLKDKEDICLNSIKKNIFAQVSKETSAEKINRIKEEINNKTYNINVDEVVKKMLR